MRTAHRLVVACTFALLASGAVTACGGATTEPQAVPIAFDESPAAAQVSSVYSDPASPYLTAFRARYALGSIISGATTDYEKVQAVSLWTRRRWQHNGDHVAIPADPVSILDRAATGERFRCVEYAIVVAGVLQSVGIPARVLGLKTADVETRATGAGHVVAEAWLADRRRWVMIDGQWDAIPTLNGEPIDAVTFQQALASRAPGLSVSSLSNTNTRAYFAWVAPYLYYFDYALDQRIGVANNAGGLMLVPVGASNPAIFQRTGRIGPMTYTHNRATFYSAP